MINKFTKTVCTLGPASEPMPMLTAMVEAGMDVARLNFSHGTHANHKQLMQNVRAVSKKTGKVLCILQDLQGPKIRMGELAKPLNVQSGEQITLGKGGYPVQYDLSVLVKVGQRILIDDGLVELEVLELKQKAVVCVVIIGGMIISHKGINIPESNTNFSVFTKKDQDDLKFGLKNNVDVVALSFVRTASDIREVRAFIKKHHRPTADAPTPWVMAKIEKPQAIHNIDEIIAEVDAIMVARGDLGIETPEERVPILQKVIIKKCLAANKPVITATQMLDSMMRNPRPTRAEIADIANAVLDHTDATMLSGESAFGKYPRESVVVMAKTALAMESSELLQYDFPRKNILDPLMAEAAQLAKKNEVPLIIYSPTGELAKKISQLRLKVPTFVFSESESALRKLALVWGVMPMHLIKNSSNTKKGAPAKIEDIMRGQLLDKGLLESGTQAVFVIGKALRQGEKLASVQLKDIR